MVEANEVSSPPLALQYSAPGGWQTGALTLYVAGAGVGGGVLAALVFFICCKYCSCAVRARRRQHQLKSQESRELSLMCRQYGMNKDDDSGGSVSVTVSLGGSEPRYGPGFHHLPGIPEAKGGEESDRSTGDIPVLPSSPTRLGQRGMAFSPGEDSIPAIDADQESPSGFDASSAVIHSPPHRPGSNPFIRQFSVTQKDSRMECVEVDVWKAPRLQKRSASLDSGSGDLEEGMEENGRRLFRELDRILMESDHEEPPSKVRYNDIGSLEDVNYDSLLDLSFEECSQSTTMEEKKRRPGDIDIKRQYLKLWELRATFEDDEEEAEAEADGDDDDDDDDDRDRDRDLEEEGRKESHSPIQQPPVPVQEDSHGGDVEEKKVEEKEKDDEKTNNERCGSVRLRVALGEETSSFESSDATEERQLEHIRLGVIRGQETSSFESEDSSWTEEAEPRKKLTQMKSDSGYKSMEGGTGTTATTTTTSSSRSHPYRRRRREFSRERQHAFSYDYEGNCPVFLARILASAETRQTGILQRDFSIDRKSDILFREFSRRDPLLDREKEADSPGGSRSKLVSKDSIEEEDPPSDLPLSIPST